MQPTAAKELSAIVNDVIITASRLKRIVILSDNGSERLFPPLAKGTFYIVPEAVARNIYRFNRSSLDLLYPRRKRMANGVMYVEALGMVYTNNLPTCT